MLAVSLRTSPWFPIAFNHLRSLNLPWTQFHDSLKRQTGVLTTHITSGYFTYHYLNNFLHWEEVIYGYFAMAQCQKLDVWVNIWLNYLSGDLMTRGRWSSEIMYVRFICVGHECGEVWPMPPKLMSSSSFSRHFKSFIRLMTSYGYILFFKSFLGLHLGAKHRP